MDSPPPLCGSAASKEEAGPKKTAAFNARTIWSIARAQPTESSFLQPSILFRIRNGADGEVRARRDRASARIPASPLRLRLHNASLSRNAMRQSTDGPFSDAAPSRSILPEGQRFGIRAVASTIPHRKRRFRERGESRAPTGSHRLRDLSVGPVTGAASSPSPSQYL